MRVQTWWAKCHMFRGFMTNSDNKEAFKILLKHPFVKPPPPNKQGCLHRSYVNPNRCFGWNAKKKNNNLSIQTKGSFLFHRRDNGDFRGFLRDNSDLSSFNIFRDSWSQIYGLAESLWIVSLSGGGRFSIQIKKKKHSWNNTDLFWINKYINKKSISKWGCLRILAAVIRWTQGLIKTQMFIQSKHWPQNKNMLLFFFLAFVYCAKGITPRHSF